jgi:hypothetical protein
MKLSKHNFKTIQIVLRLLKVLCGTVGTTFVINDYKWLGLIILAIGALANEGLTIIKEEDEEINNNVPTSIGRLQPNQEIGDGC